MTKNYVTKTGRQSLEQQLDTMINVELSEAISMIADAVDKGDPSENTEYEVAKAYHEGLSKKILNLRHRIDTSCIIKPISNGRVNMLSRVKIKNQTGQVMDWVLVPENEIDIKEGKISFNSPVGMALLGKTLGESVSINVPAGELQLEILEIQ